MNSRIHLTDSSEVNTANVSPLASQLDLAALQSQPCSTSLRQVDDTGLSM